MADSITQSMQRVDKPVQSCDADALGFANRYVRPLADRIDKLGQDASLTVGIYGTWGSGKTSLMYMLEDLLTRTDPACGFSRTNDYVSVRFTAWKYTEETSLWRALIKTVLEKLKTSNKEKDTAIQAHLDSLYKDSALTEKVLKVKWLRLAGSLVSIGFGVVLIGLQLNWFSAEPWMTFLLGGGFFLSFLSALLGKKWLAPGSEPSTIVEGIGGEMENIANAFQVVEDVIEYHEHVEYIEQFSDSFKNIAKAYLDEKRLIIFIDDLDRCLPDKAVQVLEGIKLFLDVPQTIFVLGVDVPVLVRGIEIHYSNYFQLSHDVSIFESSAVNGRRYLEKVVEMPFDIPPISVEDMLDSQLISQLMDRETDRKWLEYGVKGLSGNPRAVKRFARIFRHRLEIMNAAISANPEAEIDFDEMLFAKLIVLQEHHKWANLINLVAQYTTDTKVAKFLQEGPLVLIEKAATDAEWQTELRDRARSEMATTVDKELADYADDLELLKFLKLEPLFGGEQPINPLNMIRLSVSKPGEVSEVTLELNIEKATKALMSIDRFARTNALAAIRQQSTVIREEVFKSLFGNLVASSDITKNPDDEGLNFVAESLKALYEIGVGRDYIKTRKDLLRKANSKVAGALGDKQKSRQAILDLLTSIGVSAEEADFEVEQFEVKDVLGMQDYVNDLVGMVKESLEPLNIGLFGIWGSGKSSFMMLMKNQLLQLPQYIPVWLNVWKNTKDQLPERAAAIALVETLLADVNRYENLMGDIEKFANLQKGMSPDKHLKEDFSVFLSMLKEAGYRVIFMFDDIDRCEPSIVIDIVSLINEQLITNGVYSVLATDKAYLTEVLEKLFSDEGVSGKELLSRIFQHSVEISDITAEGMANLVNSRVEKEELEGYEAVEQFVEHSPGKINHFIDMAVNIRNELQEREAGYRSYSLMTTVLLLDRWPILFENVTQLHALWDAITTNDVKQLRNIRSKIEREASILDSDQLLEALSKSGCPELDWLELVKTIITDKITPEIG